MLLSSDFYWREREAENNRAQFQSEMSWERCLESSLQQTADWMLECCECALVDGGIVKLCSAEEATVVFLELKRRHAPSGEQLHGRPLRCLSD